MPSSAISLDPQREKREGWRPRFLEVHFHRSAFLSKCPLPGCLSLHRPVPRSSSVLPKSGQLLPRAAFYLQNPQNVLECSRNGTKLIKPSSQSQPHLSTHRQSDEGTSFASRPEIISRRRATLKSKTGRKYQNSTESSQNSTRCWDKFSIHLYIPLIKLC